MPISGDVGDIAENQRDVDDICRANGAYAIPHSDDHGFVKASAVGVCGTAVAVHLECDLVLVTSEMDVVEVPSDKVRCACIHPPSQPCEHEPNDQPRGDKFRDVGTLHDVLRDWPRTNIRLRL